MSYLHYADLHLVFGPSEVHYTTVFCQDLSEYRRPADTLGLAVIMSVPVKQRPVTALHSVPQARVKDQG